MCGIVGYIGKQEALPILMQGLRSLEYLGYDSAGLALISDQKKLVRVRAVGKVDVLTEKVKSESLSGNVGIAHTRWATRGGVTEANAHPHVARSGKIALVHNGIIENYRELKSKLDEKLESETDSEILVKWIAKNYKDDLTEAVRKALTAVRGTYGILVVSADEPETIVAARLGSPLVIGMGEGEHYVASDVTPLLPYTKRVTYLDDGEIAEITAESVKIFNLKDEVVKKQISQ